MCATAPDAEALGRAAALLRSGGLVAYPTDTLYGLAADPRHERAVSELYRIKGRLVDRALPLIAADLDQIERLAGPFDRRHRELADAFWPGPLSLVVAAWPGLSAALLAGLETVAVRVPNHALARGLARALGHPITSTSANRSGCPPTAEPDEVESAFRTGVDLLIDGGRAPGGPPSTIVDATGARLRLIREGAIPWARLEPFDKPPPRPSKA